MLAIRCLTVADERRAGADCEGGGHEGGSSEGENDLETQTTETKRKPGRMMGSSNGDQFLTTHYNKSLCASYNNERARAYSTGTGSDGVPSDEALACDLCAIRREEARRVEAEVADGSRRGQIDPQFACLHVPYPRAPAVQTQQLSYKILRN